MKNKHSKSRTLLKYIKYNKKLFGISAVAIIALIVALVIVITSIASYNGTVLEDGNLMKEIDSERNTSAELTDDFKDAYSKFLFSLSSELIKGKSDNAAFSVTNVASAISLLANGSDGKTREQLESVLGMSAEEAGAQLAALEESVKKGDKDKSGLVYSNDLLLNNATNYEIYKSFLRDNGEYFGLDIQREPFRDDIALKKYSKKIEKLFSGAVCPDIAINQAQYMQVSSAASFVGTWKNPSCELDVVNDMYIFNNNSFQSYFYKSIENNKITGETYNGVVREYTDGFSFVALVPSEKESISYTLEDVFSELMSDKNKYTNLLSLKKKSEDVAIVLPNYKNSVDTPTTTDLTEVIRKMGADEMMKKSADFGNMAKDSTNLHLDKFYASGDIVITPLSHGEYSKEAKAISDEEWKNCKDAVVFDRSFVYFIVDNASGLPIYFALVNDLN